MHSEAKTKNILIGLFVLLALTIAISALLFLKPKVGDGKEQLKVRFTMIDKVNVGTRVTFAGKAIGEVISIQTVENPRNQKSDDLGRLYFYELTLRIDSKIRVYATDDISLQTLGLFGEKTVSIVPKAVPQNFSENFETKALGSHDIIYARAIEPWDEAIEKVRSISTKMDNTLDVVQKVVQNNATEIDSTIKSVQQTFLELQKTLARSNDVDLIGSMQKAGNALELVMHRAEKELSHWDDLKIAEHLSKAVENFRGISEAINDPIQLKESLENFSMMSKNLGVLGKKLEEHLPKIENTIQDFAQTAKNTEKTSGYLCDLAHGIEQGEGNLGKLLKKDDLYLQATSVLSKVETLMNDINSYGLLFQSNSTWKKNRSRKMEELSKLKTPEQIVTYFEKELDQVSVALTRMNQAIKNASEKANPTPENEEIFKKSFREVIDQLGHVQGMVKLYNQRLYGKSKN